jgi:serine/threonine-protein kinase
VTNTAEVASALATAHARGLVHRDITPANVMLTAAGAKVVDFGISAVVGQRDAAPDGSLLGTPAYLAPERLGGASVSPATDVYALGLLLYRALTGRLPWPAENTAEALRAHLYADPEPVPDLPGLPPGVADLCLRCLAKSPADRPGAAEVARALAATVGLRAIIPPIREGERAAIPAARGVVPVAGAVRPRRGFLSGLRRRTRSEPEVTAGDTSMLPPRGPRAQREIAAEGAPPLAGGPGSEAAPPLVGGPRSEAEPPLVGGPRSEAAPPLVGGPRSEAELFADAPRFAKYRLRAGLKIGARLRMGSVRSLGGGLFVGGGLFCGGGRRADRRLAGREVARRDRLPAIAALATVILLAATVLSWSARHEAQDADGTHTTAAGPGGTPVGAPAAGGAKRGRCVIRYEVQRDSGTDFEARLTVYATVAQRTAWRVEFSYPGTQRLAPASKAVTQLGRHVVVTGKGRSRAVTLQGDYRERNPLPLSFVLNGQNCRAEVLGSISAGTVNNNSISAAVEAPGRTLTKRKRTQPRRTGSPRKQVNQAPSGRSAIPAPKHSTGFSLAIPAPKHSTGFSPALPIVSNP